MEMDMTFFKSHASFKDIPAEDMMGFAYASLAFKKHKVITTSQASLLFKLKLLALNVVDRPWIREQPFQHIWFNEDGEIAVAELMNTMGLSNGDLDGMPDKLEDDIADYYFTSKFLMHRSRLEDELRASRSRVEDVVQRYAVWF